MVNVNFIPPPPHPTFAPALDEQIPTTSRFCQSRLKKLFLPPLFEKIPNGSSAVDTHP